MTTNPPDKGRPHWDAFGASVRGSAHVRDGLPNQDAVACYCGDGGAWAVVAVADGHGHSTAVRADVGARIAVQVAVESARSCWEALETETDRCPGAAIADRLPAALVNGWRAGVERDLAAAPLDASDLERSGHPEALSPQPALAYGTTLIVAMAVAGSIVACEIGDGDLVGVTRDGSLLHPLPTDSRLVGTRTTSLASRTALDDFRSGHLDLHDTSLEVLVAATDGYVTSFSADDGFPTAARDLWKLLHERGPGPVHQALNGWLESTSGDGSGDDASLAILFDQGCLSGTVMGAGSSKPDIEGAAQ